MPSANSRRSDALASAPKDHSAIMFAARANEAGSAVAWRTAGATRSFAPVATRTRPATRDGASIAALIAMAPPIEWPASTADGIERASSRERTLRT